MNIFLPYEEDIRKSINALDDKRLGKQIVECFQLLSNSIKEANGETVKGYAHHPVYLFYKNQPEFLAFYGIECCYEYGYRFNKYHKLHEYFGDVLFSKLVVEKSDIEYTPYYMSGSKGQPNYIRTTENVSKLFQDKLNQKWITDVTKGRAPKWTNREIPEFLNEEVKEWIKSKQD